MLPFLSLPLVQNHIFWVFVHYCKVSEIIVTSCNVSMKFPRLVLFLAIVDICELFLIILHHFGISAILPRIIEHKLASHEVRFHATKVTYMILGNMYLAAWKYVLGKALFLTRHYEFSIFLEVKFIGRIYKSTISSLDENIDLIAWL